jgi:NAD-dependent DNA ligase
MNPATLENEVMAHRYLYYVQSCPVISDYAYDLLEAKARAALPETSPVHGVGSDRAESYSQGQIALAKKWAGL